MLIATLRNNGQCPCPRCLVKKDHIHLGGTPADTTTRTTRPRKHDHLFMDVINTARQLFNTGLRSLTSDPVERLLKPRSWVPTVVSRNGLIVAR